MFSLTNNLVQVWLLFSESKIVMSFALIIPDSCFFLEKIMFYATQLFAFNFMA